MAVNDLVINSEAVNGDPVVVDFEELFQFELLQRIRERLTHQFHFKPNIDKTIQYYTEGFGEVRNEEYKLLNQRSLSSAVGANLDILGEHVNVARGGRNDSEYRREIYIRTLLGASEGTREDIISLTRTHSAGERLRYWDIFPASFQVFTDGVLASLDTSIIVRDATPAGVSSETVVIASHGEVPFVLSESVPEISTLALENGDDFSLENLDLLELNQPILSVFTVFYGGSFGETDEATDLPIELVGNILSEAYQI